MARNLSNVTSRKLSEGRGSAPPSFFKVKCARRAAETSDARADEEFDRSVGDESRGRGQRDHPTGRDPTPLARTARRPPPVSTSMRRPRWRCSLRRTTRSRRLPRYRPSRRWPRYRLRPVAPGGTLRARSAGLASRTGLASGAGVALCAGRTRRTGGPVGPTGPTPAASGAVRAAMACCKLGLSLDGVTLPFLSCAAPTLPAGSLIAAFDVPPSATNNATYPTALPRTCLASWRLNVPGARRIPEA